MSYIIEKKIPSSEEILEKLPLTEKLIQQIKKDRKEIINIIEGKDKRKLLIIGPCSAWPNTAVIEYAKQIKEIEKQVSNKIKIILRTYTQKPRTTLGWTGPVNQPDPFKPADIEKGIIYCREMMINVLKIGLPISDEALFTHNEGYFTDLLSWVAIGARSSEDQEHRIYASMIDHPVGLKNTTCGNLKTSINSIIAAQNPHVFLLKENQIKTTGNLHAHIVLRGQNGESNIYLENLLKTSKLLRENNITFPSIIVDCSHDNSIDPATGKKDPQKQPEVLLRTTNLMKNNPQLFKDIKGFMVESFIKTGNQNLNQAQSQIGLDMCGLSITDACIGIEETKKMILDLYKELE